MNCHQPALSRMVKFAVRQWTNDQFIAQLVESGQFHTLEQYDLCSPYANCADLLGYNLVLMHAAGGARTELPVISDSGLFLG